MYNFSYHLTLIQIGAYFIVERLKYYFFHYTVFGFKDTSFNQKFNEWREEYSYKQITYVSLCTGIIYVLFAIINKLTAPIEIASLISNIQLYLVSPFLFFVSYFGYKKKAFSYIEILLFLAPVYAASMHLYILSHLQNYSIYQTELYLMIFWIYTVSGLRFIHSIVTSLIVFFIGIIGSYLLYPNHTNELIIYTAWMSTSMIFGFLGAYLFQESQKSTFTKQMELENIANTDKLTGLHNRVQFDQTLTMELDKTFRYNYSIGILMLDVDFYKSVNDTYGHMIGDKVLIEIAKRLKENIRFSDTIYRWGGEEFIILTQTIEKEALMMLAENIRQKVEDIAFDIVGHITVSIGATLSNKDDSTSSIIKRVDEALYLAKNSGRNCIKFL